MSIEAAEVWRATTTGAYRRRSIVAAIGGLTTLEAGLFAGYVIAAGGDLSAAWAHSWMFLVPVALVAAGFSVAAPDRHTLTVSPLGCVYEQREFTLTTTWDNVSRIVQLGAAPDTLALRLERTSVTREMLWLPFRDPPWRGSGIWDRTIPLEPFLYGDPGNRALVQVRRRIPQRFSSAPPVMDRPLLSYRMLRFAMLLGASTVLGYLWANGHVGV